MEKGAPGGGASIWNSKVQIKLYEKHFAIAERVIAHMMRGPLRDLIIPMCRGEKNALNKLDPARTRVERRPDGMFIRIVARQDDGSRATIELPTWVLLNAVIDTARQHAGLEGADDEFAVHAALSAFLAENSGTKPTMH